MQSKFIVTKLTLHSNAKIELLQKIVASCALNHYNATDHRTLDRYFLKTLPESNR